MRVDDIDAAFEKAAGGADHDQADWAVYFNKALLNTFYFVSDYVFVHGMAETLREPDVNEAHRKLLGEMAPVANDLSEFTFGFAAAIFKLHFGAELTMTVVAKIADAPNIDDIRFLSKRPVCETRDVCRKLRPRQSSWNQTPGQDRAIMIFEEKERTRTDPKKPGEDEFAFYDSMSGAAYDVYRATLNEWIAEYPDEERAEAVARFRKTGSLGYQAALAELLVHATLKRQGYSVEVHPACGHPSRRPDFLARDAAGNAITYVEVTSFGPAQDLMSKSKRGATVYNGIEQEKLSAGCRLGLDIIKHGANTPSIRKLKAAVETWAAAQGEGRSAHPRARRSR
jgi:hypothetical protein